MQHRMSFETGSHGPRIFLDVINVEDGCSCGNLRKEKWIIIDTLLGIGPPPPHTLRCPAVVIASLLDTLVQTQLVTKTREECVTWKRINDGYRDRIYQHLRSNQSIREKSVVNTVLNC